MKIFGVISLFVAFASTCNPTVAATFCVHDGIELQAALNTAASNGQDDFVKLAPGTYTPVAAVFNFNSADAHGLTLAGGYDTPPKSAPCSVQLNGAQWSVIEGGGSNQLLSIQMSATSAAPIYVHDLTLANGVSAGTESPVGVGGTTGWTGDLILEDISVRNNHSGLSIVQLIASGRIFVRSSEFVGNTCDDSGGVVLALASNWAGSGPGILFNNNSIARNSVPVTSIRAGLFVNSSGPGDIRMSNNILWNNGGKDVGFATSGQVFLSNNDIGTRFVGSGVVITEAAALQTDPIFLPGDDLRLANNSPMRDAGLMAPIGGAGATDVRGGARVELGAIDVGGHEFPDRIFTDGFD